MLQHTYNTLEDLQQRKAELQDSIHQQNETIGDMWHELIMPQKADTKGELVASLISNSITAIDGFLLVRKLFKTYGTLFKRKK